MQMAVIEYAKNILKINDAISTEFGKKGEKLVGLMSEWLKG